jgi:ABC-type spermidine/putrescine transport system permease subunit I
MILLSDGGPVLSLVRLIGLSAPRLIGTEGAIEISLVQFTLPFVILILFSSLRQIPTDCVEAARTLGADGLSTFRHVVWPLSLPGVLSATLIAFSLAVSSYVTPHYLGGGTRLTLTTLIAQFILATFNTQLAATLAVVLLFIVLIVLFGFTSMVGRRIRG